MEARNGSNGITDGLSEIQYFTKKTLKIHLNQMKNFTCNSPNDDKRPAP
jgi:hypothetical protein